MFLRSLADVRARFQSMPGSFIGAGMTAFSRISPSRYLEDYRLICLRKTRDIPILRKACNLFCLEEAVNEPMADRIVNSAELMAHPLVGEWVDESPSPRYLLPYQSYPPLETLAVQKQWGLLTNPFHVRHRVSGRTFFKKLVHDLCLPAVRGSIVPIHDLHHKDYDYWVEMFGSPLVVQLPDVSQGGGRGTFYLTREGDYLKLREYLKQKRWREIPLIWISFNEYVAGTPGSMALCITRNGLLMSRFQKQLIDLPYCDGFAENGVFCGHEWEDRPWPTESVVRNVRRQAELIGGRLAEMGYRGILGIDFIVDETRNEVRPIELNARFTGAFPMLSLLYMDRGVIPMEAFHMLEFLGVPYRINAAEINEQYGHPVSGSHLLLFRNRPAGYQPNSGLRAGTYRIHGPEKTVSYISDKIGFSHMTRDNEFVIADGPSSWDHGAEGAAAQNPDPLARLCRVLFSRPATNGSGALSPQATAVVNWIYSEDSR